MDTMSVQLCPAAGYETATIGGSKPLHRFIKGQPKIVGIIVLVLGAALLVFSIITSGLIRQFPTGILPGALFIMSGILYILTEHKPTKKTVTMSLALSIVTILLTAITILEGLPDIIFHIGMFENLAFALEVIMVIHMFVGGIISIVMSVLAGAALRSTKSQATVVMTTAPTPTATAAQ